MSTMKSKWAQMSSDEHKGQPVQPSRDKWAGNGDQQKNGDEHKGAAASMNRGRPNRRNRAWINKQGQRETSKRMEMGTNKLWWVWTRAGEHKWDQWGSTSTTEWGYQWAQMGTDEGWSAQLSGNKGAGTNRAANEHKLGPVSTNGDWQWQHQR